MFPPLITENAVVVIWRPSIRVGVNEVLLLDYLPRAHPKEDGLKPRLPGGGCEVGESPEDGARREVKEETGLDPIGGVPMIEVYNRPFWNHRKRGFVFPYFQCEGKLFKPPVYDNKIIIVDYRWVTFDSALEEIKPDQSFRSQHDTLVNAQTYLIKQGIENHKGRP